ncbi:hypothetical protein K490DRAFT_47028 [Saccharata proteae CBS 121410]|uniref:Nuclear speckle splicing regulatory protein 1 N-terminal domain-containing protein n=1 Tax=Saccharata proteae CBS 121410 TaxID=1314787 RepID=A0A9P4LXQ1_9PEZI|nr:hypothetical protein K490DRAFT_47028 [Saccharata proteae CBS 121410]
MFNLKSGLSLAKKPSNLSNKPKKPIFGDDDSDSGGAPNDNVEEIGEFDLDSTAATNSSLANKLPAKKAVGKTAKPAVSPYGDISSLKAQQKKAEEAEALDPSIYDYDAAYDALHATDAAKKAAEREEAEQRKPKYMANLLQSAEVRKRDQLRAKEKLLQREREAEGDDFADKEKFVTGAYKQQQEEVRRLEAEEQAREEAERKKRGSGMQGFYRNMMNEQEKRHQEAVEAASQAPQIQGPQAQAPEVEGQEAKTDAELARELNEKGSNVVINDDGQVVDKRQLLSAGLNVAPKPKAASATPTAASRAAATQQPVLHGRHANKQAMRERQSRMMESQLEQAAKRAADDEAEERAKVARASKSRKTESDISSARERYLQRKREAAAAKTT